MAWRKVHLDGEVWEWQTGGGVSHYVIIRSPSKIATRVSSSKLGAPKFPTRKVNDEFETVMAYMVTPGIVRAYIKRNKTELTIKPRQRERKGK